MNTTGISSVTAEIQILGMSCGHCQQAVTQELLALRGVTHVSVDLASGVATVVSDGELDPVTVGAAVYDAGYDMEWVA